MQAGLGFGPRSSEPSISGWGDDGFARTGYLLAGVMVAVTILAGLLPRPRA